MLHHVQPLLAMSLFRRLHRMGGPGLILLGIADNSLIPLTGSVDVLTIWLAAHHREPWLYYATMATIGAVLGGYITYVMANKSGKEALERKLSKRMAVKVHRSLDRWGFYAIAVPSGSTATLPDRPILAGGRGIAISAEEVPGSTHRRPCGSVYDSRQSGSEIREPHRAIFRPILQTSPGHSDWPGGFRRVDDPRLVLSQSAGKELSQTGVPAPRPSGLASGTIGTSSRTPLRFMKNLCLLPSNKPWIFSVPMT